MPAILHRMAAGIAGDVSRKAGAVIETVFVGPAPIAYGSPVQLDASGCLVLATDAQKDVYGFLVRPYPTQASSSAENALGAGCAPAASAADVLRSGYISVRIAPSEAAAALKGARVCVVFAATGGLSVGDIAASKGTAVPRCTFMGGVDASGNAEIVVNI